MFVRLLKNKLIIHFKISMEITGRKVKLLFILAYAKKQKVAWWFDQKKECFLSRVLNLWRMRRIIRFWTCWMRHQDQYRTIMERTFCSIIINARNQLHMHNPAYSIIAFRACQQIHWFTCQRCKNRTRVSRW